MKAAFTNGLENIALAHDDLRKELAALVTINQEVRNSVAKVDGDVLSIAEKQVELGNRFDNLETTIDSSNSAQPRYIYQYAPSKPKTMPACE